MSRKDLPELPYWDGPLSHPFYSKVVKRILDLLLALVLLIPGIILMIPLAVWVKLDSPGPVIYKAVRGGYHNRPFTIFKFRSMVVGADKTGGTTAMNDARVTRAGRIMRKLKLDELPQLFNILIGDMSFVGFRPCLWNEYELDDERRKTGAYRVRPGITGIAQIRGRDELRPAEKARLDGVYARHVGFDYDLRIVTKTILYVFYKEGYREGGFADE